jgi:hypothetical protein
MGVGYARSIIRMGRSCWGKSCPPPLRGFALRAVAEATLSHFVRLEPPTPELLHPLRATGVKKPALKSGLFRMWSAREDDSPLRGFALRAVAGATLSHFVRLEPPPPELLHPLWATGVKKPALKSGLFRMWSAREDSNLRPTGPKPVALPSCATRRCGPNVTAAIRPRQSLLSKSLVDRRETRRRVTGF